MVFKLQSGHKYMVEMAIFIIYYVQRAITPKEDEPVKLLFCTCEKFHENVSYGFQLYTEWTRVQARNGYVQCSKGNNFKSKQTRVTVHVVLWCFTFV